MHKPQNLILVIFGASGDLTKRKLIPSLFQLFLDNLLPENFGILGVSRTKYSDESFRTMIIENISQNSEIDDEL